MKNSIIVIGTHIVNYRANYLLTNLVNQIQEKKYEFGIVSNSEISNIHYKNAKFYMFDSENDKFEETKSSNFWYENESFKIESPSLFYGAIPNYSLGAVNLFINSIVIAKKYGYRYLHWIEYDRDLPVDEIKNNQELLDTPDISCVVYSTESEGHPIDGSFISLNLEKIDIKNFLVSKEEKIKILNEYGNSAEKFTYRLLSKSTNVYKKKSVPGNNNFSQAKNLSSEFCFLTRDSNIEFFIKNNTQENFKFRIKTNLSDENFELYGHQWRFIFIGSIEDVSYIYYTSEGDGIFIDPKNEFDFQKYISPNKFIKK